MGPEFGHFLDSLGWAIVHSLWQGTLAAIAVVAFRSLTKDNQAAARYGFQVIALVACLTAFVITFGIYHVKAYAVSPSGGSPLLTLTALIAETRSVLPATADISLSRLLTLSAPVLGVLWCLGFTALAVRYFCAFLMTQQLRHKGTSPVPQGWKSRFKTLVLNAGIRRHVQILISDRVSGPLTLGFFKPIVLVPASFFSGLPAAQVEAILLHEIAHIRRHDYLVNLLQTVIKTVFFFHPAAQYISRKIDHDREHACDDFAVALTQDPQSLARGLAALRLDLPANRFTLAADNGNTPLVARLKRLGNITDTRRRPEHIMTSVATLVLAAGLYMSISPFADAQPTEKTDERLAHPSGKTGNYHFAQMTQNDRTFTVKIAENGTRWINVNGQWYDIDKNPEMLVKLPEMPEPPAPPMAKKYQSNAGQYQVDLDYYNASVNYAANQASETELAGASRKTKAKDTAHERMRDRIEREIESEMDKSERAKERAWERADKERERAHEQAERQREAAMERADAQLEAAIERAEAQREAMMERAEAEHEAAMERAEEQRERVQEQAEQRRHKAEVMRKKHAKTYKSFSKALMSQLKKDGLIDANAEAVTITYPGKKMTVNGKRVPSNLEGRYCDILDKYDVNKTENTRIKIKPASFEYKSKSKDGKSSHHIHEDFEEHDKDAHLSPESLIQPTRWTQNIQAVPVSFSKTSFSHPAPESWISQTYTIPGSGQKHHTGIDLAAPMETPIRASAPGIVTYAKTAGKWGNMIKISHNGGYETHYAHVGEICVAEGEQVSRGYNIATVGSTGASKNAHLHFEIHRDGEAQNPKDLIQGF